VQVPAALRQYEAGPQGADIQVSGLVKAYGALPVLRGLGLTVHKGERLLLLGQNGSGKTTLLKILATLIRPTAGRALVQGWDVVEDREFVRGRIGLLSHQTYLYGEMTVLENLRFYSQMYSAGLEEGALRQRLHGVGMDVWRNAQVRTLSRGMQQRVALVRALLHAPQVLLLDEPDTGLDQRAADSLVRLLEETTAEGRTVLLTSHNLERGLSLADRVAVLQFGRIVYESARSDFHAADLETIYRG